MIAFEDSKPKKGHKLIYILHSHSEKLRANYVIINISPIMRFSFVLLFDIGKMCVW